ncbi:hypothetical protein [Fibrella aestuarina]|uniref:hypothetical protein n=1 Tax=Fibrella aestuarina TaxID=651143 RepID=UPI0002E3F18E|nr:hypothetical protein [Fibrella aestuarina]
MSIRDSAEKMVSDYHDTASPHHADDDALIERIVSLVIATYNKGLARAEAADGDRPTTPDPPRRAFT